MIGADTTARDELIALLREQLAATGTLQRLLEEEGDVLCAGDPERVLSLANEKQSIGMRLTEIAGALNDLLKKAGHPDTREGLQRYVAEFGDQQLTELYGTAMSSLGIAATHNEANGRLVERRRCAVARALRVFLDRPEVGASRYHRSGQMEGTNPNRLIGEA